MSKADIDTQLDNSGAIASNIHPKKGLDLTDLPNDIFFLICSYLPPQYCVLCRRVSRLWFQVFTNSDTSWSFMKLFFPRSREMRRIAEQSNLDPAPDEKPNWTRIFTSVAKRYYYLRSAKPRLVEKLDVIQGNHPVHSWSRTLTWNYQYAIFQHDEPSWTLDGELLVYADPTSGKLVAYDLETASRVSVPFDTEEVDIRRMRLACGVLVIEWCEGEPFKTWRDMYFRHYITFFDVIRRRPDSSTSSSPSTMGFTWDITFRSELHFYPPGLALHENYRFFSAHTSTHYVIYYWISDYSVGDPPDPREELTIWDISKPSSYRASLDPTGANRPVPGSSEQGPTVVNTFSREDLDFLGLKQGQTPRLREILLDDASVYFQEEDHCWLMGSESNPSPPRHHQVRCTGFPYSGIGPRWFDECCADGNVFMSFCPRSGSLSRVPGNRPLSFGSSRSRTWPGWAPCWRHEEFPYLTVSDVVDPAAGVRVVARQCFMMETLSSFVLPIISVQEERNGGWEVEEGELAEVRFEDGMWKELLGKGKIMGDERWVVGEDSQGRVTIVRF